MLQFDEMKAKSANLIRISDGFSLFGTLVFCMLIILMVNVNILGQTSPSKIPEAGSIVGDTALMSFENRHIALGKVKKGEKIAFSYKFTNTGKEDLQIDFITGCDCSELDWPVKAFKPGESGSIDVVFLSAKKEKGGTVEIDVLLKNKHPVTGNPLFEIISYSFEF